MKNKKPNYKKLLYIVIIIVVIENALLLMGATINENNKEFSNISNNSVVYPGKTNKFTFVQNMPNPTTDGAYIYAQINGGVPVIVSYENNGYYFIDWECGMGWVDKENITLNK